MKFLPQIVPGSALINPLSKCSETAALGRIGYEMSIRACFEDHVSPLPWLVID
jgi:hypothetical protein